MNRPWLIWAIYVLSVLLVLATAGWMSNNLLMLERSSQRQSLLAENMRLALWRIDSTLSGMIAAENGRPYYQYVSWYRPADILQGNMPDGGTGPGAIPSNLLDQENAYVKLYFQIDPQGVVSSPQIPVPSGLISTRPLSYLNTDNIDRYRQLLSDLRPVLSRAEILVRLDRPLQSVVGMLVAGQVRPDAGPQIQQPMGGQEQRSGMEQEIRQQAILSNNVQQFALNETPGTSARMGIMQAQWYGRRLLLLRRVQCADGEYIQGCWMDWTRISREMAALVADLLPNAELVALHEGSREPEGDRLASLPAQLAAGEFVLPPSMYRSPMWLPLVVAWVCLLLAVLAVGGLLIGVVSLSERRGAFVSAVTHELRTPLTTFRMYAEMLAGPMVTDEEKRRRYLETLKREALRLSHLVENVLSFAGLERGGRLRTGEGVRIGELVEHVLPRMSERAGQVDMELCAGLENDVLDRQVAANGAVIEQILFNLVDNACKYAAASEYKSIYMHVYIEDGRLIFSIRDFGAGVDRRVRRKLFRPFSRSAEQAAGAAPGVGLGLALSRRLARRMGGELRLERNDGPGALFVLMLPTIDSSLNTYGRGERY